MGGKLGFDKVPEKAGEVLHMFCFGSGDPEGLYGGVTFWPDPKGDPRVLTGTHCCLLLASQRQCRHLAAPFLPRVILGSQNKCPIIQAASICVLWFCFVFLFLRFVFTEMDGVVPTFNPSTDAGVSLCV